MNINIKVVVAGIVTLVVMLGGGFYWQQRSVSALSTPAVVVDTAKYKEDKTYKYKYKDGTYSADSTYGTPGGVEGINVSVTLSGGTIMSAQVINKANNDVSKNYQRRFSSGYTTQVVGKYIEAVQFRAVSGSSLTPNGFMDALANIMAQAKS